MCVEGGGRRQSWSQSAQPKKDKKRGHKHTLARGSVKSFSFERWKKSSPPLTYSSTKHNSSLVWNEYLRPGERVGCNVHSAEKETNQPTNQPTNQTNKQMVRLALQHKEYVGQAHTTAGMEAGAGRETDL